MSYLDTVGGGQLLDWQYRPLDELENADNTSRNADLMLDLGANYKFGSTLTASISYRYEKAWGNGKSIYSIDTYTARNLINLFYNPAATNTNDKYPVPRDGIADISKNAMTAHAIRGQLNYNKTWGKHQINALAGWELSDKHSTANSFRVYGYNDAILTYGSSDVINGYPTYDNLAGVTTIPDNLSFADLTSRFVSQFINAGYNFDNRLMLNASARRDAANIYGVNTNNRFTPLWSVGAGWNISNERFYKVPAIPYLKARASFGYRGNTTPLALAKTLINYVAASTGYLPYATISGAPNPELRWEQIGMFNFGVDFALKNDRLSGSIEYYTKATRDLLAFQDVDPTTGILSIQANSANLKGNGIDLQLNARLTNGPLQWRIALLGSYINTRLVKYLREPGKASDYAGNGSALTPLEGKNPYLVISYPWGGLDPANGNPRGYLGKSLSTDYTAILQQTPLEYLVYHGPALPPYFGSLRNTISWKGIELSANIAGRFKYFFRRNTISYSQLFARLEGHPDYLRRWQQPGDELHTTVPSMIYPAASNRDGFYQLSAITVEKADHIRINDLSLGYNLPARGLSRTGIKALRFYLYANNLNILLWRANKAGLDPNNPNDLPMPRTVSAGVKLDF
ncbi:hypothetical protein CCY01nite_39720 [Chitinophaga cymbidii]|uniref:TonB-dependent receptor-like beta-barrel domain-containing protein n=2 Tax=Chitinophaga cymbidii TaxID=1096750 RepID=A0A512RPT7_9BACT|nr:hypothetical protein CCY01nite_39720 [Chitinophaga cymbidii]